MTPAPAQSAAVSRGRVGANYHGKRVPLGDGFARLHQADGAVGQRVLVAFLVVVSDPDPAGTVGVFLDGNSAIDVGQHAGALGRADFKEFLHAGQASGDVGAGDAAGVEGTHGQLGARLADALGGDDAHGLADFDQFAGGGQPAVAHLADAPRGLAGQGRAHGNAVNAGVFNLPGDHLVNHFVAVNDDFPAGRVGDYVAGDAAGDALGQGAEVVVAGAGLDVEGLGEFAVVFADDDLLGHVNEAASEIAAVGGAEGGVGETLAGAVGGDEVLQGGEALAEAGLHRTLDDAAFGVAHQAAHTGHLLDLGDVALGAGGGHDRRRRHSCSSPGTPPFPFRRRRQSRR